MVNKIFIVAIYFAVFSVSLYAAPPLPEKLSAGVMLSIGKVQVDIETIVFSSVTPVILAKRWGADDSPEMHPPKRIIQSIKITSGDKDLILPASSFIDLCNVSTVSVIGSKNGFTIKIKGADAGGAYAALLVFEKNKIKKRRVSLQENLNNVWEETIYHSEFPNAW